MGRNLGRSIRARMKDGLHERRQSGGERAPLREVLLSDAAKELGAVGWIAVERPDLLFLRELGQELLLERAHDRSPELRPVPGIEIEVQGREPLRGGEAYRWAET